MLIHVVNAQVALAEALMEISELRLRVEDRDALRSINETLEFAEDVYWRRKNDQSFDGPFCPTCWDAQNKLVRLKFYEEGEFAGIGHARR
jgi:hypothetical protein